MKKAVVVIPAYNEGKTIRKTLENIWLIKEELSNIGVELKTYVVNDGSNDETGAIAKKLSSKVITYHSNQGLGAAVRVGLETARNDGADFAVKFDADCQHESKDIISLLEPLLEDKADVVYGNRFKNISYRMPPVRFIGNIVFTSLMRWLTGWKIEDSQPGVFAVNQNYLEVIYLPGNYNYTQQVLLNAYNEGLRFLQVPVAFNKRQTGESFISFKYPFRVLPQLVQVLVGIRPLKVFGTIGVLSISLALLVSFINIIQYFTGNAIKPIMYSNLVLGVGLFGFQTLFFGFLADMIVQIQRHNNRKFRNK